MHSVEIAPAREAAAALSGGPILFLAVSPKYGGAEKHTLDLLASFQGSGHPLQLLCTGPDVFSGHLKPGMQDFVSITRESGLATFLDWYRLFRRLQPEVVVLVKSWVWCFPWYTSTAAWLAGVKGRVSIYHFSPRPAPHQGPAALLHRLSYGRLGLFTTLSICVSEALRRNLVAECGHPAASTVTVANGVDLAWFSPDAGQRQAVREQLGVAPGEVLLVCLAGLTQTKRIDVLLEALAGMDREIPWRCLILGDGELRGELEQRALHLKLGARVTFLGFQSDVRGFLRAADVFVLTSDVEGLPLSVLEAMACGVPCVATNVGGVSEVITDGVDGFVVPPGDAGQVGRALTELIRQPQLRRAMAEAARRRVQASFDIQSTMSKIRKLILSSSRKEKR